MAWRLMESVIRGEIDNRVKGHIKASLWLAGLDEPIELDLVGNGHRDVAGSLFVFENDTYRNHSGERIDLARCQTGAVGDYTASRKVKSFDLPIEEALEKIRLGDTPSWHWANSLYFEWYSDQNGRVVLEGPDFSCRIIEKLWDLSDDGVPDQKEHHENSFQNFIQQAREAGHTAKQIPSKKERSPKAPMDEFEWERFMKESSQHGERFSALLEQYGDHPQRDRMIAEKMGWDRAPDAFDIYRAAVAEGEVEVTPLDLKWTPEKEMNDPNPLTEGVDWILGVDGQPVHPLYLKLHRMGSKMKKECAALDLLGAHEAAPALQQLFSSLKSVELKLACALNDLGYEEEPSAGFVVACLKRALPHIKSVLEFMAAVQQIGCIPDSQMNAFKDQLFILREEVLDLMERFRGN